MRLERAIDHNGHDEHNEEHNGGCDTRRFPPSFRRTPESRCAEHRLDSGFRRDDDAPCIEPPAFAVRCVRRG